METWGHRAAESRRQAHSHPGGEAPGRGHCRRSQLCFVPLHPGENPFPPTSAWGPCRCRQLKAAGRGERGAEQGAEETWLLTPGPCSAQTVALHTWVLSSTRQSKRGPTPN